MHPKNISIYDYTYDLPEEKIARYPLSERDASRLLIYRQETISEDQYRNIASHLPKDSLLVFNNSKVVEARLLFQKPTGGIVEIFCLEPAPGYGDITKAIVQKGEVLWQCLVGGASKWKPGQVLEKKVKQNEKEITLYASYVEKKGGSFIIRLNWTPGDLSFAEILHLAGAIPLPPYIKREAESLDSERYQTIYAHHEGSVAAPTAGLHFTESVFASLKEKNIEKTFVTLHVGAGTFKPVKSETMEDHEMHAEFIDVHKETIHQLLANDDIIAVGTTSLRTIESLYWLGVYQVMGINQSTEDAGLFIDQWGVYDHMDTKISRKESLEALLAWMEKNKVDRLLAKTKIIIAPGYEPRMAKALVTNFHQPQSTLLLLIAGLIGNNWKNIYEYALQHDFRFLSYGDGCLLWVSP